MLQRDKSVAEEQNSREKEMLLHRLRDHEHTIKEQHKRLRAFQVQYGAYVRVTRPSMVRAGVCCWANQSV